MEQMGNNSLSDADTCTCRVDPCPDRNTTSGRNSTPGRNLTCRISNIPARVSKKEFEVALRTSGANLRVFGISRSATALIRWSYARSGHSPHFYVATATFSTSPAPDVLEASIKKQLRLESTDLRVDLNFFGLTPLADPDKATVESVSSISFLLFSLNFLKMLIYANSIIAVTGLAGHAFGSWKL